MIQAIVVDDEPMVADMCASVLQLNGYDVTTAYSGKEGIQRALQLHPQIVVSDIAMPDVNGVEVAQAIHRALPSCRFLFFSGLAQAEDLVRNSGIQQHSKLLAKPAPAEVLLSTLKELLI